MAFLRDRPFQELRSARKVRSKTIALRKYFSRHVARVARTRGRPRLSSPCPRRARADTIGRLMTPLLALLALAGPPAQGVAPAGPGPAAPAHPARAAEMRGLWVVRTALVSPEAVDAVVDQAKQAGFNALFVQVRGRGDAFYSSRLVPRSLLLETRPASFDPLARLLRRAHGLGLQVHAWVNVLLAAGFVGPWPPGHVAALHPEW